MDNFDYFDAKLGRAAAQIATVLSFGRCVVFENGEMVNRTRWNTKHNAPPDRCYRHALMWRELDWSKFAALVTP
jgi:hypothetical protein